MIQGQKTSCGGCHDTKALELQLPERVSNQLQVRQPFEREILLPILKIVIFSIIGILFFLIALHTIVRVIRHFHKFPMPEFAANIIDNPIRRWIQPPNETPARHKIEPGMKVLEVGPGNGTYTMATARRVGESGEVVTIDIEPKMIERVKKRGRAEGIKNVEARVADVFDLPFEDGYFDAVYMITVIGEIPTPEKAMGEFHRVLSPQGTLSFSELLMDPDYPLAGSLERMANTAGFCLNEKLGNFFYYTLIFEKMDILKTA
jgi:SAM-dependent methyltransferase